MGDQGHLSAHMSRQAMICHAGINTVHVMQVHVAAAVYRLSGKHDHDGHVSVRSCIVTHLLSCDL